MKEIQVELTKIKGGQLPYIRTKTVQDCQTLDELRDVFNMFGIVIGSHKEYNAEKLNYKLDQLQILVKTMEFDRIPWTIITRTYGIRAKCMELFWYEKYEK
jgi:hypothetical protein